MQYRIKKSNKLGLPPGIAQYSGDISGQKVKIEAITYPYKTTTYDLNTESIEVDNLGEFLDSITGNGITWLDIQGIHNEKVMKTIADHFNFHPILREDLLSPAQRPKFDSYDDHLVFFLRPPN